MPVVTLRMNEWERIQVKTKKQFVCKIAHFHYLVNKVCCMSCWFSLESVELR